MKTGSYSIDELAEETGFDRRVIRSFIEQGLLRGPESKGRYARYTAAHLIRLKVIRLLRDHRQMTLGEIRSALLSMTEEDLYALAQKAAPGKESSALLRSSVLDYLRSARQPDYPDGEEDPESITGGHRFSAVDRLMMVLQEDLGTKRPASQGKGQIWHRFAVTPDIEISVRGLQDGGQVEQWDQIADCLREILLGGARNE